MKILVISLAGIGDTLFATPLIKKLREIYPKSRIDVLALWTGSKQILAHNPYVNNIYQFDMVKEGGLKSLFFCLKLRRNAYDLSINTYPQSKSVYRIVSFIIGARKRLSHRYDNYNLIDNLLVNSSIRQDYKIHSVLNNLKLLSLIGIRESDARPYEIHLSKEESEKASGFLKKKKIDKNVVLLGISTGTSKTKNLMLRRWPLGHYKKLIEKALAYKKNLRVLMFVGPEEIEDCKWLTKEINDTRLIAVKTETINEAAAIVQKCDIFLSVDNIFMHLAAALKVKKQIVINTPTLNETVFPYRNDFVLVGKAPPRGIGYRYDGKGIYGKEEDILNYMKSTTPEQVFNELLKMLRKD